MVQTPRLNTIFLIAGIVLCLLQIWLPQYLTGDGPCHLYNAQIVHDLWLHKNTEFYNHFYRISYQPNPNWLSTFALAALLFVVNGAMAEKIFLTCYVLLYVLGFYRLIKKISSGTAASWWPFTIFIVVFTHVLTKGFYNFSFGIAFYFWMVLIWLSILDRIRLGNVLLFFLFSLLAFFSHLLPFALGAGTCGALVLSYSLTVPPAENGVRLKFFLRYAGLLALLMVPFLLVMYWFTGKEGGLQIGLMHHFYRLVELAEFRHLMNRGFREMPFTIIAGCTLIILLILTFISNLRQFRLNKYDGFLLSFAFILFVYLFFPDDIIGRQMDMKLRTQLFVIILSICVIAYRLPSVVYKNWGGGIIAGCFIVLCCLRGYNQSIAAGALADYTSVKEYIKPYSVVLPLDLAPWGIDEKRQKIDDDNFSFCHALQYIGTDKPLIILDNYEANISYFPVQWNAGVNPYCHLSAGAGIEGLPPYATIAKYKEVTGTDINYVVVWGFNDSFMKKDYFRALYAEINTGYKVVYTSPGGRTMLFEKK